MSYHCLVMNSQPFRFLVPYILFGYIVCQGCQLERGQTHFARAEVWFSDEGLSNIESIIYDSERNVFYVSNGHEYKLGIKGYISKISEDGQLIDLTWIDSLSRPTGMAIIEDTLYVADVDRLRLINIVTGTEIENHREVIQNSGLNDVAVNKNKEVYVSASAAHAIYKMNGNELELWLQDSIHLQWANGLWSEGDRLYCAGQNLVSIHLNSKEITSVLTPGIEDFDGIVRVDSQMYLSTIGISSIWVLDANGATHKKLKGPDYYGDFTFVPEQNALYIPQGNHDSGRYYISKYRLP